MTFDLESCGARIKGLRIKNGLTQEKLADDMNITDVHLRRIESGTRAIPMKRLIKFAEYFHVSLDYLIFGRDGWTTEAEEERTAIKERGRRKTE